MCKVTTVFKILILILIINVILNSCSKKAEQEEVKETIIAKIGSKSVSENELIRRAEYTIRPPYCRLDNNIHKKIILNSLIAEKMLALEAGEDNELTQNENFQDYLNGRKEQAMRQLMYYKEAFEKVELDTNEIKKIFKVAGREYDLEFCSLKDSAILNKIKTDVMQKKGTFAEICKKHLGIEEPPTREVAWKHQEEESIHDALFSEPLKKDQIVGPIQTSDGRFLLMNVSGWTDSKVITDNSIRQRWNDVSEKLTNKYAEKIFEKSVAKLMRGKRVEFARDTFMKLTEVLAPLYIKTEEEKKDAFNKQFWNKETTPADSVPPNVDEIIDKPILQIDGQVWTVRQLQKEIVRHPLVFRKRKFNKNTFPEQFKLAVVDLIRDKYITKDAYKKGYDKTAEVQRNFNMWKDNLLSMYQKNKYLKSKDIKDKKYMDVINDHLNEYIDSLQVKYSDVVEVDTDKFDNIEFTRIDMYVVQKNVPFPVVVPGFPLLTTDYRLNYGKKQENIEINRE